MNAIDTPRIYVACLASYNAGTLHGEWIDFTDAESVREEIARILRESPNPNVTIDCPSCDMDDRADCDTCKGKGEVASAEEYAVHDHEGWYDLLEGEWPDIDELETHVEMLEKHGPAWAAYINHTGADADDESGFEDAYAGEWDNEEAYAIDMVDSCYDIERLMGSLSSYFDYERFARDLFMCDYYSVEIDTGGIYVFRNC